MRSLEFRILALRGEITRPPRISRNFFVVLTLLIIGGATVRSAIATRLDGFTIDEPYHIAAGGVHQNWEMKSCGGLPLI